MKDLVTLEWLNALCERQHIERGVITISGRTYFRMSKFDHHLELPRDEVLAGPKRLLIDYLVKAKVLHDFTWDA